MILVIAFSRIQLLHRHSMMLQCWLLEPEKGPSFSQLVETLSESLEYMVGYVHIGAFGVKTNGEDFH